MSVSLYEGQRVLDVDTHLTEPPDVWTDRLPKKWGEDAIPHIERRDGVDAWYVKGTRIGSPGPSSLAGFDGVVPDGPKTFDEIDPSMYQAGPRLKFMDEHGIDAQVLYPNVGGFGGQLFRRMGEPELVDDCLRAYNDFLVDFASADPNRLIPVMSTPFWDVDFAVREIERCVANGHRAINFCNQPDTHGDPPLSSAHWDPIWAAAQDAGVPISFHIGGGDIGALMLDPAGMGFQANFGKVSSLIMVDNMRCVADLIFGGICHRFPNLKFVSVESGVGWIPGVLETFDWQWKGRRDRRRAPRVRPVAFGVLPPPDLRVLLVRARQRRRRHRALPGQHPLRDRLPAPDLSASRPPVARPGSPGLHRGGTRRVVGGHAAQGPLRQRGRPLRRPMNRR